MPRMCTNRYVRQAQKAVLLYFRDFEAIEVQLSHVCENPVQRSLNTLGRKTTERSALHFRCHEEAVPSGTLWNVEFTMSETRSFGFPSSTGSKLLSTKG